MPRGSASGSTDSDPSEPNRERGSPRDPPDRLPLPRWAAPLPARLEAVALRLVWVIVAINLVGTAFGFWYYRFQFAQIAPRWWVFVPDSPGATLLIALALAAWAVGRPNDTLASLAFVGNIKLGLWTPYVLVAFAPGFLEFTALPMYLFLFWSHVAMAVQAFVLHRISGFPLHAIAIAAAWYTVDLLFDYFVPLGGQVTHTSLPYAGSTPWFTTTVLQVAAAGAVALTIAPIAWLLATRVRIVAAGGQPWE
ncbi:DUF1405 domain-containing protein [Halopenitus persicus]|uniref:Uncharacterized membrane protein YpjA n=1 Tax=Halopenitus persicus TaxID=1048396 RepID=A0A1H3ECA4_9EURY|nr:DUF1405 domain-containing protein [Halopenitus persicus]SDX76346.1 Uncharacterized membrane protein YpjA [Halopenitus persicus]